MNVEFWLIVSYDDMFSCEQRAYFNAEIFCVVVSPDFSDEWFALLFDSFGSNVLKSNSFGCSLDDGVMAAAITVAGECCIVSFADFELYHDVISFQ